MKSVIVQGVNQLAVEEIELDEVRQDEVRVKMAASGVCHSDLSILNGTIGLQLPLVLGHEGAGVVEEVGDHVTLVKPGDHVVLAYTPQCGKCFFCTVGQPNLCESAEFTRAGSLPNGHRPALRKGEPINQMTGIGTMSEFSVVHETSVIPIDPDIPLDKAALVGCGVMTGVGSVTKGSSGFRVTDLRGFIICNPLSNSKIYSRTPRWLIWKNYLPYQPRT